MNDLNKFQTLLQSRKFWAAIIVLILILCSAFIPKFPLDPEITQKIVLVAVAYILGVAIDDNGSKRPDVIDVQAKDPTTTKTRTKAKKIQTE